MIATGLFLSDVVVVKADGGLTEAAREPGPKAGVTQVAILRDSARGIAFSTAALGGDNPSEQYVFPLASPELKVAETLAGKEKPYFTALVPGGDTYLKQSAEGMAVCGVETGNVIKRFDPSHEGRC